MYKTSCYMQNRLWQDCIHWDILLLLVNILDNMSNLILAAMSHLK